MIMPWLKVIHLLGAIAWIGGLLAVAVAAVSAEGKVTQPLAQVARTAALRVAVPGMVLAWIGGLTMFALGIDTYLAAGWMHAKLTLVLIASGLSGVLTGRLRRAAAGQDVSSGSIQGLGLALVLTAALAIIMVILGPIWMA